MSFAFGFSGDDIEDEGLEAQDAALAHDLSKTSLTGLDEDSLAQTVQPKRHSLEELLASLPSQISFNTLNIAANTSAESPARDGPPKVGQPQNANIVTKIYRRSLFDIRAQLMAEANPSSHDPDSAETLLAGLENGDLSSGIYEGGFKTWECALDLASLLMQPDSSPFPSNTDGNQNWEVIELGAGSASPSLAVLRRFLRSKQVSNIPSRHGAGLKVTLCDYNEDVLRLGTAPNVFLNYLCTVSPSLEQDPDVEEGELDIEEIGGEDFVNTMIKDLLALELSVDFISGGWGDEFVDLLRFTLSSQTTKSANLLILASETIYSPSSIKAFSQTLISLLFSHHQYQHGGTAKAWIAAKKVYFGVGGGVDEFVREIDRLGGVSEVIFESKGTGVGRVVLEIRLRR